jgi:aryl-alcohol dehydrogenase-like predicted oxidoreductase
MNVNGGTVPALGFGCSPLLGRTGRRSSLNALAAAFDSGIRFFDTARSYGYGEGEALLGEFLRGKRDRVIVSTKFGIVAAKQQIWKRIAKPLVRGALMAVPSMRKAVRAQIKGEVRKGQFTVSVLRRSIEESLSKLGTDYVDILFMHEASASVLRMDDLLRELERLIQEGKVRAAGISSDPDVVAAALDQRHPAITALQFPCNVFDLSMAQRSAGRADHEVLLVANHPFGGVLRVQQTRGSLRRIAGSRETPVVIREKLGKFDDRVLAEVVLNAVTCETGIRIVIPSMMRRDHLLMNVEAMNRPRFSRDEIFWLRNSLAEDGQTTSGSTSVGATSSVPVPDAGVNDDH